jgi:hypothetical protein
MHAFSIEHALYGGHAAGGYRFLAKSPGFLDEWLPLAERLCMGFGERPPGVACPLCVFAQPLGRKHVAVVQAADQGYDDADRPGVLAFYLLVVPREEYELWDGDPFALADRFPPPWQARGDLASLTDFLEPPAPRTVAEVQRVLKRDDGPKLLGATQALVDGGRVVFERRQPDTALLRDLWLLLPTSTRAHLWPASFAFGNDLQFHALASPRVNESFYGYILEDQAGDYPEGRYERGVQIAAETGDQRELDALFHRSSRQHVLRLGLFLFVAMLLLWGVMKWMGLIPSRQTLPAVDPVAVPNLPARELCLTPDDQVRKQATAHLRELAQNLGLEPAPDALAKDLIEQIDEKLGTPDPKRSPGPLKEYGPEVQRELRVLMWKHGVERYDDVKLNTAELAEHLRRKVDPKEKP